MYQILMEGERMLPGSLEERKAHPAIEAVGCIMPELSEKEVNRYGDIIDAAYRGAHGGADACVAFFDELRDSEREVFVALLTSLVRHHDVAMNAIAAMDDGGIARISDGVITPLETQQRTMLARLIVKGGWRYVPLIISDNIEELIDDIGWLLCDEVGDNEKLATTKVQNIIRDIEWQSVDCGDFPYAWDEDFFQGIKANHFPDSILAQSTHMMRSIETGEYFVVNHEVDACSINVPDHVYFKGSRIYDNAQIPWDDFSMGACPNMEKTFQQVLDPSQTSYGRGVAILHDGMPLGVMKFKGNPSFLAARTVRDASGDILLVRGMTYAIAVDTLAGTLDDQFGQFMKDSIFVDAQNPFPAVDIHQGSYNPYAQKCYFKPLRFVRDASVYRTMHDFVHRKNGVMSKADASFSG